MAEDFPEGGLSQRAQAADFTTLATVGFPILAVIIATQIQPVLGVARAVVVVALVEYAAILWLGLLAFAIGSASALAWGPYSWRLHHVVFGLAGLAFAALCAFATFRVFTGVPRRR